jgi:hypothetical protein
MQAKDYRWMLVDGFVEAFNKQRELFFEPSTVKCAWTSPSLSGMVKEATGSTLASHSMSLLIVNLRMVVRYRILLVLKVASCFA